MVTALGAHAEPRSTSATTALTTSDGTDWTWSGLFDAFGPAVSAYARSRGVTDVDDLTQDVFLAAFHGLGDFEGDDAALRSWIFTIAYRRIADRHRRFYRSKELLVADQETTTGVASMAEQRVEDAESAQEVLSAFDVLDERQRRVLELRIIDELSPSEVGEVLRISTGNVRVIQARALKQVRKHLEKTCNTRAFSAMAFGVMPMYTFLRDLRGDLPSDGLVGSWIDQVRDAAASGAIGTAGSASAAGAGAGSIIANAATGKAALAGASAGASAVSKIGAAAIVTALAVGGGTVALSSDDAAEAPSAPPASVVAVDNDPDADASTPTDVDVEEESRDPIAVIDLDDLEFAPIADPDDGSGTSEPDNASGAPAAGQPGALDDVVSDPVGTVDDVLGDPLGTVDGVLEDPFGTVDGVLDDTLTTVDEVLDGPLDTVDEVLQDPVGTVNDVVDDPLGTVDDLLDDTADGILDPVDDLLGGDDGSLLGGLGGLLG